MSGNGEAEVPTPARRPRIVIEFDGVNGSELKITPDNDVTTGQLYAAAWLLDAFAHETRVGERAMLAARPARIVLPGLTGNQPPRRA